MRLHIDALQQMASPRAAARRGERSLWPRWAFWCVAVAVFLTTSSARGQLTDELMRVPQMPDEEFVFSEPKGAADPKEAGDDIDKLADELSQGPDGAAEKNDPSDKDESKKDERKEDKKEEKKDEKKKAWYEKLNFRGYAQFRYNYLTHTELDSARPTTPETDQSKTTRNS